MNHCLFKAKDAKGAVGNTMRFIAYLQTDPNVNKKTANHFFD